MLPLEGYLNSMFQFPHQWTRIVATCPWHDEVYALKQWHDRPSLGCALTVTIRKISKAPEKWQKQGPGRCLVLKAFVYKGEWVKYVPCLYMHKVSLQGMLQKNLMDMPVACSESWWLSHLKEEAYFWLHVWKLLNFIPGMQVPPVPFFFLSLKFKEKKCNNTALEPCILNLWPSL